MKIAVFGAAVLLSLVFFTLGVASLPVASFPYKGSYQTLNTVSSFSGNNFVWGGLTGFQILEFQSGPTITSFTLDFTDSNGDAKANTNENVNMVCSATDSNGLDFILLTRKAPGGGSSDYGSGGAASGATSWTIPSTSVSLVEAGTYTFICTARNVNGTSTTSSKTLDVTAAPSSSPSGGACSFDPRPYNTMSTCQGVGCIWCSSENICKAPQEQCGGSSTQPTPSTSSSTCNVDPSQYKTQSSCNSVGCTWCPSVNGCRAGSCPSTQTSSCNANGVCDSGESQTTCSKDCGISSGYLNGCGTGKCGDGSCNINCNVQEDWYICHTDCPKTGSSPATSPTASPNTTQPNTTLTPGPPITNATLDIAKNGTQTTISLPRENASIMASEILQVSNVLEAFSFFDLEIPDETTQKLGINKLKIEVNQNVSNASIEIKTLDAIPLTDEKGQSLTEMPKPEQPVVKVIQFIPSTELGNSISQAEINFELTDEEMARFGITTAAEVVLTRFAEGNWAELPTEFLVREGNKNKFKAITTGFSVFVVTKKAVVKATPSPTVKANQTDKQKGKDVSLRKSTLLSALVTVEQFKIRFEEMGKTAKAIADYYLSANKPADYTTWFAASQGFYSGAVGLEEIKKDIKSVKAEPTEDDVKIIESKVDDVLKILDTSLDFLLKDVLDIGPIPDEEKLIPLAEGQSIKFQINNETHTITIKSIEADGTVQVEIASTVQNIELQSGEEQKVKVAETASAADTLVKLSKVEKKVAYISIKSTFSQGVASKKTECTKISSSLTISDSSTKCFEIIADNIVLDGNNQVLDGDSLAYGIIAENRKGITIKNFVLINYLTGIKLSRITNSVVENNKISSITGIELSDSSDNQIQDNQIQLVSSSGTATTEDQTPEGQSIALNEIVLVEKPGDVFGVFEPYASITNNIDPADYKDVSGNSLTELEFTIETTPTTGSTPSNGQIIISLGKGQTKLVKTGATTSPTDNTVSITIKIIAQNGLISQEFTREARTDR